MRTSSLENLEQLRNTTIRNNWTVGIIFGTFSILLFIAGLGMFGLFLTMLLCFMPALFLIMRNNKKYRTAVKEELFKGLELPGFTITSFDAQTGFDKDELKALDVIPLGNRYYSNDLVRGSYNGLNFTRSDVLSQQHTSNGKSSTTTTLFKGQVYKIDMPKRSEYIRVKPKRFLGNFTFWGTPHNAKTVTFEDSLFNDTFDVAASDAQNAYYIFTPIFMSKVRNFFQKYGKSSFVLMDREIYVATESNQDSLEISLYTPINKKALDNLGNELLMIEYICKELDLLNPLFKENV